MQFEPSGLVHLQDVALFLLFLLLARGAHFNFYAGFVTKIASVSVLLFKTFHFSTVLQRW
jgi:hypothetical protein